MHVMFSPFFVKGGSHMRERRKLTKFVDFFLSMRQNESKRSNITG